MPDTEVDPDLADEDELVRRMGFNPSPGAAQVVRDHRTKRARERRSITVNEMLATDRLKWHGVSSRNSPKAKALAMEVEASRKRQANAERSAGSRQPPGESMEPDEVAQSTPLDLPARQTPDAMEEVEVDALEDTEDDLAVEEELAEEEASALDLEFVPLHSDAEVDPQALEEENERVRRAAAETRHRRRLFRGCSQVMGGETMGEDAVVTYGQNHAPIPILRAARGALGAGGPSTGSRPCSACQSTGARTSRSSEAAIQSVAGARLLTAAQWAAWHNGTHEPDDTHPPDRPR